MTDIYKLGKDFQADLISLENHSAATLGFIFDAVEKRIEKELEKLEKILATSSSTGGQNLQFYKLIAIRDSLKAELASLHNTAKLLAPVASVYAPDLAYKHLEKAAKAQLGENLAGAVSIGEKSASITQNLKTFAGLALTDPMQELFQSITNASVSQITDIFSYHIARGDGPGALAREIRKTFQTTKARAATIARTEVLRSYRETSRRVYEENSDLIKGYIWVARLTSRTCAVCWALHGSFHKLDKPFGTHPNCRCVMVPFMGGKNPVTLGATVFKNLPDEKKLQVLGPGKFELYQAEGIPLKYLVGYKQHLKWGPVRYERTIDEMKQKLAIPGALGEDKLPAGTHAGAIKIAKQKLQTPSPAVPSPAPPPIDLPGSTIKKKTFSTSTKFTPKPGPVHPPDLDHDALKLGELHGPGTPWGELTPGKTPGYGGVIFDDDGRVLLRKPKNNHDGYHWTFPKGKIKTGEHPVDAALRKALEGGGQKPKITGFVPGEFKGSGSDYYFIMRKDAADLGSLDDFTDSVQWATRDEALELIKESTNAAGQARDLDILEAAFKERDELLKGKPAFMPKPPAPPEPPKPLPWEKPPVKVAKYKRPTRPADFPLDPKDLVFEKNLGGSTGARLFKDPATGKRYVYKSGTSPDHILSEFYSDEAYRALGVSVPRAHVYEQKDGSVVKLAEYLENSRTLKQIDFNSTEGKKILEELRDDLAIDALLGNYDVVGLDLDNVLVDAAGKVWRIDNGGALKYRAQGALKTRFDDTVSTLWTMRGKTVLADDLTQDAAKKVFGDVGLYRLRKQIDKLTEAQEKKLLLALPDELRDVIQQRLRTMRDLARHAKALELDDWVEDYADDVVRHIQGIRGAGIPQKFPKKLEAKAGNKTTRVDENGKVWDNIRTGSGGEPSLVKRLVDYAATQKTNLEPVWAWKEAQGGHSWSDDVLAFKFFIEKKVKLKKDETFWYKSGTRSKAEAMYKKQVAGHFGSEDKFAQAHAIYKAYNMEFLTRVEFDHNDRATGIIRLLRTEDKSIFPQYGIIQGNYENGLTMKRGLSESFSVFERVRVHGSELTVQRLPYTRVHGTYFTPRGANKTDHDSGFLGDGENEFACLFRESKDVFDYVAHTPKD